MFEKLRNYFSKKKTETPIEQAPLMNFMEVVKLFEEYTKINTEITKDAIKAYSNAVSINNNGAKESRNVVKLQKEANEGLDKICECLAEINTDAKHAGRSLNSSKNGLTYIAVSYQKTNEIIKEISSNASENEYSSSLKAIKESYETIKRVNQSILSKGLDKISEDEKEAVILNAELHEKIQSFNTLCEDKVISKDEIPDNFIDNAANSISERCARINEICRRINNPN